MYIYKITNKQNNKVYIGRTVYGVEKRFQAHWKAAQNGDSCHLHLSMKKYGVENFIVEQIDTANSIEELSKKEAFWVAYYDAYNTGYNMTLGGDSNPMECVISKTKHDKRMRDPEVRKKISDSMKAYKKEHPVTESTCKKLSESAKGNQKGKGKKRPQSAINATSKSHYKSVYCMNESNEVVAHFESVTSAAQWWYSNGYDNVSDYHQLCDIIKRNAKKSTYYSHGLKWYYK